MRKFIAFGPALVVLLTALVTLIAAPAAVRLIGYASTDTQIQLAHQALDQDTILKQIDKAVRSIGEAVEPSVVHIAVEEPTGRGGRWVRQSQGSGWVFDGAGHIVTNAHVVRGARRIMVQFQDGRAVEAETIGHDPTTDIAVVQVKATEGLFPIQRATGLELHQGERVYAFGSPFGFKFSMSEGIVSGLGRDPQSVIGHDGYTNFIQTDAAVNPGNSGGPLVNVEGKLVGMNVAIATAAGSNPNEGQSAGISFAIPLATIESVADQLISGGVVAKGYLGITHAGTDEANLAELSHIGFKGRGVMATGIAADGPAAKAGLESGDIITRLNEKVVTGVPVLRSAITNNLPGDKITVDVWRNGETKSFMVTLGSLPPSRADLDNVMLAVNQFGISGVATGNDGSLVITSVAAPSLASKAGIRAEQVIVDVGGTRVVSRQDFLYALAERGFQQGRDVKMTVQAGDQSREVTISSK